MISIRFVKTLMIVHQIMKVFDQGGDFERMH